MLASLNNLTRFKVDKTYSILPEKQLYAIASTLSAYKFSMQQGGFMFSHETVLNIIFPLIIFFNENNRNKIRFIKSDQQPQKQNSKPTEILHLTSYWVLISKLQNDYVCLFETARTKRHPDTVTFSKIVICVV